MTYIARKTLLAIEADAKTVKGEKLGVMTGVLYLAPANISGFEVCPKRSNGCTQSCLYTSGRGMYQQIQDARINKTVWFHSDRASFMEVIVADIERLIRKAKKHGMIPAVRLNGTSDIAWEKVRVIRNGIEYRNVMLAFPDVQFYDYTKIRGRKSAIALPNYHLTFSLSENNDADAFMAINEGYNVAVVLNLKKGDKKPAYWRGYPVIDGDETDVRFFDPKGGNIVALFAKGQAKKDSSGFVRDAYPFQNGSIPADGFAKKIIARG